MLEIKFHIKISTSFTVIGLIGSTFMPNFAKFTLHNFAKIVQFGLPQGLTLYSNLQITKSSCYSEVDS